MSKKVSRGYYKLENAIKEFHVEINGKVCADLGSSTGGFVECLLENGATKVYAVETGYGVLDWKLRNDPQVVVMERTNALHVELPEKVDLVSIDASWTRQEYIIPKALELLKPGGVILSLLKPHYEASKNELIKGKVDVNFLPQVINRVKDDLEKKLGDKLVISGIIESPITGIKGANKEYLLFITKR